MISFRSHSLPQRVGRGGAVAVLAGAALLATTSGAEAIVETPVPVYATVETTPVVHAGDAADDPAIWVDRADPGASLVIGNDKKGALETYNLDGSRQQRLTGRQRFWGNVDVASGVVVGSHTVDLVASTNAGLRLFAVNPATRLLQSINEGGTGVSLRTGSEGLCIYHSTQTGATSVFVITRPGLVQQLLLADADDDGLLEASTVRTFSVGAEAEGCVTDPATGALYVSEEDVGVWRYNAEPDADTTRVSVDTDQPTGHLAADSEGITLVSLPSGGGYVIASAQNVADPSHSYFVVYDRLTNAYVSSFRVETGTDTDGCERTDGVAAYAGDLGSRFPHGLFVCQDNGNMAPAPGHQNFKLVPLERVVSLAG